MRGLGTSYLSAAAAIAIHATVLVVCARIGGVGPAERGSVGASGDARYEIHIAPDFPARSEARKTAVREQPPLTPITPEPSQAAPPAAFGAEAPPPATEPVAEPSETTDDFEVPAVDEVSPEPLATSAPPRAAERNAQPRYPAFALRRGLEGWVDVRFTIDARGEVGEIEILDREGTHHFEQAVLDALREWRFEPPAAPLTVRQAFHFRLKRE